MGWEAMGYIFFSRKLFRISMKLQRLRRIE
jgi:hypothetical protein